MGLAVSVLTVSCTSDDTTPPPSTTVPASTTSPELTTAETLESLGGEPCSDSEFTCVVFTMPLDHFDPGNEATIDVTFAVRPADGESQGAFVTLNGGPGASGIVVADDYLTYYPAEIAETFDMVFFDPRGIGSSGGFTCPHAAAAYYRAEGYAYSASGINRLIESTSVFVSDCLEEMGHPDQLAFVSTEQVAEDLEVFRQAFEFDQFVLFGESYGTQVGQTYAAAHGGALDRLVIDGVVDLTLEGNEYHRQMAEASSRTLDLSLAACDEDPWCSVDMRTSAGDVYSELAAQLREGPLSLDFPLPTGGVEPRTMSLADFETAAAGSLYSEADRMMFNRALAAYGGRGDLVPLLRLAYINLVIDPATEEAIDDPTWSDAMYYAVECLDYAYPGETPEARGEHIADGADGIHGLTLGTVYYGDLPCAFWPHGGQGERPPPLVAEGIPTLVLGSTVDPVTPYQQGVEVHSRLADGHIISKEGGPHVIFGWGEECPDAEVAAFIVEGTAPSTDMCDGVVVDEYVPLFPDPLPDDEEFLLDSIEWEIIFHPDYYYWDGVTDSSVGCYNGGTWSFSGTDDGNDLRFDDCELVPGVTINGTGAYDFEGDIFTLSATVNGCSYEYQRAGDEYEVEGC